MTADDDPENKAQPMGMGGGRRHVRIGKDSTWRFLDEHSATAERMSGAIGLAQLRAHRSGSLPLDAIEDAVGKELVRRGYPPRLGRFAQKMRVREFPDGNIMVEHGSWSPLEPSASPPPGHVVTRHPALAPSRGFANDLADLLVLVDEVRSAIAAGDAEQAALRAWRLCASLDRLGGYGRELDQERGRAVRVGARAGRRSSERNVEKAEKWRRWRARDAELRAQDPRRKAIHRARMIAKETGDNPETIRKWLRKHKEEEL